MSNINNKKTLTYTKNEYFKIDDTIKCAVPDGFRYNSNDGVNFGWTYAIPETAEMGSNHIDAKPFSFAISSNAIAITPVTEDMLDKIELDFKLKGFLNFRVMVRRMVIDSNCAYLYQSWYDGNDPTYNKVNGFLLTKVGVYQFHAYYNHSANVDSKNQNVIDYFLSIVEDWMKKTSCEKALIYEKFPNLKKTKIGDTTVMFIPDNANNEETTPVDDFSIAGNELLSYDGNDTHVVIPDFIERIDSYAFSQKNHLESIKLNNGLKEIGANAFENCTSLKSINIPDSVTFMDEYAFSECSSLTEIKLSHSITKLNYCVFSGCTSLKSISIPNSITYFDSNAFSECSALESINIPYGVTHLGDYVFYKCTSLKSIIIPDSVTYLGESAFFGCSSLTEVKLSNSITELIESVLYGCKSLKNLEIPSSVTKINKGAISSCENLERLTIPKSVISVPKTAFEFSKSLTIYCEAESRPDGWNIDWDNVYDWKNDPKHTVYWGIKPN